MSKDRCIVPGCPNNQHCRKWCQTHYSRWRLHGDVQAHIPIREIGRKSECCGAKHYANGLCANHYMQQWIKDHPEEFALRLLRRAARNLGLDEKEVVKHFQEHSGRCDICGRTPQEVGNHDSRLSIDHDHKTGRFRGLLCDSCNRAIGLMGDDPARLEEAARYLRNRGDLNGGVSGPGSCIDSGDARGFYGAQAHRQPEWAGALAS